MPTSFLLTQNTWVPQSVSIEVLCDGKKTFFYGFLR